MLGERLKGIDWRWPVALAATYVFFAPAMQLQLRRSRHSHHSS